MAIDPTTGQTIPDPTTTVPAATTSTAAPAVQPIKTLYDFNTLTSQQVGELAAKARSRNAGEGQSTIQQAQDQARYEENQYLNSLIGGPNEAYRMALSRADASRDPQYQNIYNSQGPVAAAIYAYNKEQGTLAPDNFSQVVTNYNQQAISDQGSKQQATTSQALSLPTDGQAITNVGAGFTQNGVDVAAPPGTFAVQYANGAVEFRQLPASGKIPTAAEIQSSGRAGADVGSVGKEVARTGATLFNPTSGADVTAPQGKYVVEYKDGTYEFKDLPSGGFIPSPSQLKQGGDSSGAQSTDTAGKTKEQLQAEQGITPNVASLVASGADAQTIDAAIVKAGKASTSSLELIGPRINGKTASAGNLFYQDPKTGTILQRPATLQSLAKQSTNATVLAQQKNDKILSDAGIVHSDSLATSFQSNPIGSFSDIYAKILNDQGATTVKAQIQSIQDQQKSLDEKHAEALKKINENPYYSEAIRSKEATLENSKYDTQKSQLDARMTLNNSLLQEARQQAQFVASTALAQYNADRTFQQGQLEFAQTMAEKKLEAQATLAQDERQFQATYGLNTAKFQQDVKEFGMTYALDRYKAENPSSSGSTFERLLSTVPLTGEQKLQAIYSQLGITPPGGTQKPLSGDAAKVYAITQTIQPEIDRLIEAYQKDYKGSVKGIVTQTNSDLYKLALNVADKVGRLRSGGAINTQESNNFMKQIASLSDLAFGNSKGAIERLNALKNEANTVQKSLTSGTGDSGGDSDPLGILGK